MKVIYDPEVDALYLELHPLEPGTAECRQIAPDVTADCGPDGRLAGIEILDATKEREEQGASSNEKKDHRSLS